MSRWQSRLGLTISAVMTLVCVAALGVTPAQALKDKTSQRITLFASNPILGLNDSNEPGSSEGDIRTLSLTLSNVNGKKVGTANIVQTLVRAQVGNNVAVKSWVLDLRGGTISGQGITKFTDMMDPLDRPIEGTDYVAVVGGTGKYRGITGEADVIIRPGFKSKWIISYTKQIQMRQKENAHSEIRLAPNTHGGFIGEDLDAIYAE